MAQVAGPQGPEQYLADAAASAFARAHPQENIWQFMRHNWLSNRIFKSFDDDHAAMPGIR
jgi:hypothetical protein